MYFADGDELDRAVMQKPVVPIKKANLGSAAKARTPGPVTSANAGKNL